MITITLPNTEGAPLRVQGSPLFAGEAHFADGKRRLRLSVFRCLNREGYAYSAAFESTWKHEVERYVSRKVQGAGALGTELRELDPTIWVRGYERVFNSDPRAKGKDAEGREFVAKHQSLMHEVTDRWNSLVAAAMLHVTDAEVK